MFAEENEEEEEGEIHASCEKRNNKHEREKKCFNVYWL